MNERIRKLAPRLAELLDQFERGELTEAGVSEIAELTNGMSPMDAALFFSGVDDVVTRKENAPGRRVPPEGTQS